MMSHKATMEASSSIILYPGLIPVLVGTNFAKLYFDKKH